MSTAIMFVRRLLAHRAARLVGAAIALLAVLWAVRSTLEAMGAWRATSTQLRSDLDASRRELTQARAAYARAAAKVDALEPENRRLRDASARADERAAAAEREADSLQTARHAITPPSDSGTASDSAAYYRAHLAEAERENARLRDAREQRRLELASRDSVIRVRDAQLVLLRSAGDSVGRSITGVQPLLQQAGTAIRHAEPRCRIARLIPCPSRTTSAVGGAVVTAVVFLSIKD